ncbi:MAG: molybdopterin molybdotransferase MoeA [Mycobacteriaceae bacterium]|nr:molybdopterin molybdotransferase MoeA [Mycobacteriaceae bacterium]
MRSVEEQQARVLAAAVAPRPIHVAIAEAQGLICAEEVAAERPLPGFEQAAIDGYAVRSVDVRETVILPVTGTIKAGARTPSRLQPKQAARVQTGAPLPTSADTVLPVGWTDPESSQIRVRRDAPLGAYVRPVGADVRPGDVVVRVGTSIGAAQVALLAAVGRERVLVHPRPRLSVLAVGGELVDVARTPGIGQVYDVNSYALAAAGRDAGADVNRVGIVGSDPQRLRDVVEGLANRAEILVIAAGVGGAVADELCSVLAGLGGVEVARVGMHPGSVQGFGRLGRDGVPTFVLPANPLSALVIFEVMVRPLIRLLLGRRQPMRRMTSARALLPIASVVGRKGYVCGQLMRDDSSGDYVVQTSDRAAGPSSDLLSDFAQANCLVMIPSAVEQIRAGEIVDVAFLDRHG